MKSLILTSVIYLLLLSSPMVYSYVFEKGVCEGEPLVEITECDYSIIEDVCVEKVKFRLCDKYLVSKKIK